jgi:hypothetical protein
LRSAILASTWPGHRGLAGIPGCIVLKTAVRDRINLPTGGMLIAPGSIEDPPDDCTRVFGLLPLVACYLASTQCLVKVLALVGPLVDLVKTLGTSPASAAQIPKVLKAAENLAPCEAVASGLGVVPFLKDLLCLILTALNCTTGKLKVLVSLLMSLSGQLAAAKAGGNAELVAALEAEQQNAQLQAARVAGSTDSMRAVLDLAGPMFALAGLPPPQLPVISQTDLTSLNTFLASLESSGSAIQILTDSLGGC